MLKGKKSIIACYLLAVAFYCIVIFSIITEQTTIANPYGSAPNLIYRKTDPILFWGATFLYLLIGVFLTFFSSFINKINK